MAGGYNRLAWTEGCCRWATAQLPPARPHGLCSLRGWGWGLLTAVPPQALTGLLLLTAVTELVFTLAEDLGSPGPAGQSPAVHYTNPVLYTLTWVGAPCPQQGGSEQWVAPGHPCGCGFPPCMGKGTCLLGLDWDLPPSGAGVARMGHRLPADSGRCCCSSHTLERRLQVLIPELWVPILGLWALDPVFNLCSVGPWGSAPSLMAPDPAAPSPGPGAVAARCPAPLPAQGLWAALPLLDAVPDVRHLPTPIADPEGAAGQVLQDLCAPSLAPGESLPCSCSR